MKNFFITGGTSGIGYNCVKYIAKDHNNRVLIISSNEEKGKLAVTKLRQLTKNKNINFLQCDLSSIKETNRLIYNNQIFKIDVLINNAGAIYFTKQFSNENIEKTFALNHMGYFSITNFLLKKNLIKNGAKIINIASGAHWGVDIDLNDLQMKEKYNGWLAYKKSKLCNILFTRKLSKLLIQKQISVKDGDDFDGVFIRAPAITKIGSNAEAIAWENGQIVGCVEGENMALTFHPELTDDLTFHKMWLKRLS